MAYRNQTAKYGLPQWHGDDKPERVDFNKANLTIEGKILQTETKLAVNEQGLGVANGKIAGLEIRQTASEQGLDTTNSNLDDLEVRQTVSEQGLDTTNSNLEDLEGRQTVSEHAIDSLNSNLENAKVAFTSSLVAVDSNMQENAAEVPIIAERVAKDVIRSYAFIRNPVTGKIATIQETVNSLFGLHCAGAILPEKFDALSILPEKFDALSIDPFIFDTNARNILT